MKVFLIVIGILGVLAFVNTCINTNYFGSNDDRDTDE
jgi:hypothetical protein